MGQHIKAVAEALLLKQHDEECKGVKQKMTTITICSKRLELRQQL